jgi:hypothetical protein
MPQLAEIGTFFPQFAAFRPFARVLLRRPEAYLGRGVPDRNRAIGGRRLRIAGAASTPPAGTDRMSRREALLAPHPELGGAPERTRVDTRANPALRDRAVGPPRWCGGHGGRPQPARGYPCGCRVPPSRGGGRAGADGGRVTGVADVPRGKVRRAIALTGRRRGPSPTEVLMASPRAARQDSRRSNLHDQNTPRRRRKPPPRNGLAE